MEWRDLMSRRTSRTILFSRRRLLKRAGALGLLAVMERLIPACASGFRLRYEMRREFALMRASLWTEVSATLPRSCVEKAATQVRFALWRVCGCGSNKRLTVRYAHDRPTD